MLTVQQLFDMSLELQEMGIRLCPNVYSLHCNNGTYHYVTTHVYTLETKHHGVWKERDKNVSCFEPLRYYKVDE